MKARVLGIIFCFVALPLWAANPVWLKGKTDDRYEITVYRSASCGCCKGWVKHLEDHNFDVVDISVDDVNKFKAQFNVPTQAASCHTASVNGITIEGHVPAQDIKRLLADKGDIRLLTVPAMPSGTPGMDTPGAPKDEFHVYSVSQDDQAAIYRSYKNY
ncbi:MAG: DUF411 domain-containing protein [bacterium]